MRADGAAFSVVDAAVVLLVTVLSVMVNIVLAVFAGVAIAVAMFLVRMSRSTMRRLYRGDIMHSRKARTSAEMETLERNGGAILVMELQGPLFFGSAERLADQVQAMSRDTAYLVLDLNRVTEIDSTGAEILLQLQADATACGRPGSSSRSPGRRRRRRASASSAPCRRCGRRSMTPTGRSNGPRTISCATCWANRRPEPSWRCGRSACWRIFPTTKSRVLAQHLIRTSHQKGETVFRQGDPGERLFMIVRGCASAYLQRPGSADIRLATFAPGALFGELALLDAGPRSATVVADEELVCHALGKDAFASAVGRCRLRSPSSSSPASARELGGRLRRANAMIDQLEA